jgi:protein gp37
MHSNELQDILKYYPEVTGVHPACLAVPEISAEDKVILDASVERDGLRHEIVLTNDGLLIDGRNRLIACFNAKVEPRFRKVSTDPWQVAYAENIARRHLDAKQKVRFGLEWQQHEREEAKKRRGTRTDIVETFPPSDTGKARDKIGERVGVSGKSIDKGVVIETYAPEKWLDDSSLEQAYKEAAKRKKEKQAVPAEKPLPVVADKQTTTITTAKGVESQIALPKKVVFNQTNDSVDWARWTWNPVTGCEHGCNFCYAREIANSSRMADYYPNKFEPTYHPYRLEAPKNTNPPESDDPRDGRVFVCSMADLFGKWVPDNWIRSVFDACLESPQWEYLFLTKWPARYAKMPLLKKAWYGASVIRQSDVPRVEKAMQNFETDCIKWISLEPMLEPITFKDLTWCDLVVIGSQTSTTQPDGYVPAFAPNFDWVVDVVNQCREYSVPYYLKENLGMTSPGMVLPKMQPYQRINQ